MFSFLNPYLLYAKLGLGIGLALFAAWALRVNHLRGEYHDDLAQVKIHLKAAGATELGTSQLAGDVDWLATARNTYQQQLTNANSQIQQQNLAIGQLKVISDHQTQLGQQAQLVASQAVANRADWIKLAQTAATRNVPATTQQELDQCEQSMNTLYQHGF